MRRPLQVLFLIAVCIGARWSGGSEHREDASLRLVDDPTTVTAIHDALAAPHDNLKHSLDRTIAWLDTPESHQYFPFEGTDIDHDRAQAGVVAFRRLIEQTTDQEQLAAQLFQLFDLYEAAGTDRDGVMLVTAYYAPEYDASRVGGGRFRYPLYGPPAVDLPRVRIEQEGLLAGREIAWLADPLSAYLVHVNGSARLKLPDGATMCVGHVETNGRPYTSLGQLLIDEGLASASEMSMQTIIEIHRRHPQRVEALMQRNERFVFFEQRPCDQWPTSDLGIVLTPRASVATDRTLFPAGGVVLVDTTVTSDEGQQQLLRRFMVDQDRGGAITGPGRVDMYLGSGPAAGQIAGRQRHPGRLYYLLLKPQIAPLPCE
jgi:membrane-bound lytic murein transglycosylase A